VGEVSEEGVERAFAFFFEFFRGSVGDDFSLVDDEGAATGSFDFFEDVGGEDDGFAFAELFDEFADFVFLVGVEPVSGFV